MGLQDYSIAITVDKSPDEVFASINNVRGWWDGQIDGPTDKLGGIFTYRYEDFHNSKQKITELVPGKKIVWEVLEGGPKFVKDKREWKGTRIVFDIIDKGKKTGVRFTHEGLVPRLECYDSCTDAWGPLIRGNLKGLIEGRAGTPV